MFRGEALVGKKPAPDTLVHKALACQMKQTTFAVDKRPACQTKPPLFFAGRSLATNYAEAPSAFREGGTDYAPWGVSSVKSRFLSTALPEAVLKYRSSLRAFSSVSTAM